MMPVFALKTTTPTALVCSVARTPTIKTQIAIYKELLPVSQCCYYSTVHTPVILFATEKEIWHLLISILHEQVLLTFGVFDMISLKPLL